jgi:hypothetical protein
MTLRSRSASEDDPPSWLTSLLLQEEVLGESVMMIPDSQRRCEEAMKKLSELLVLSSPLCLCLSFSVSTLACPDIAVPGGGAEHLW